MNKKPRKAKKTQAKRARKIEDLSQAHGKEETFQPTTLDQIWGDTGISEYRTMDEEEYRQEIDAMNKSDLQSHASKKGLIPIDDRNTLVKRLMDQFRSHVNQYRRPEQIVDNSAEKLTEKDKRTLEEGR